jgi:hypothetical protein
MDFKLIIVVVIIVLIIGIVVILKELFSQKNQIKKINDSIDQGVNNNIKTLKNRINLITSEIKNYNNDLVIQLKKINTINSQMVTSMSNYYTESESDGNKNLIDYLSDAKKSDSEFKIKFKDEFKSDKSDKSDKSSKLKSDKLKSDNKIRLKDNSSTSSEFISITSKILNKQQIEEEEEEEEEAISQNHVEEVEEEAISQNRVEEVEEEAISQNHVEEVEEEEAISQNHVEEVEEEVEAIPQNHVEEVEEDEIIQHNHKEMEEISHGDDDDDDESVVSSHEDNNSIKLDNITIGSSNGNKGKRLEINESKSIDTNNILSITKLNHISSYSKTDLERIAKILTVPMTYQQGTIRKPYKKEELYLKLKEFIINKSK